jgi:hypothetical protein
MASLSVILGLVVVCSPAFAEEGGSRDSLNVFISPMGEPFRAGRDEAYPIDAWFNRADANHDGGLSEDEFVADAVAFFHKVDLNGDGMIDGAEVSSYEQNIAPEILPRVAGLTARDIPPLPAPRELGEPGQQQQAQQQSESPRRVGPPITGADFYSLIQEGEPVASADTDFDGKVTLAEFKGAARRKFGELDLNHDGRLDRSELKKTDAQRWMERHAKKGEEKPRRQ